MGNVIKAAAIAVVLLAGLTARVQATPVLDQSATAGTYFGAIAVYGFGSGSTQTPAQTFTAGLTGQLTSIQLQMGSTTNLGPLGTGVISLRSVVGGVITGPDLASVTFSGASIPNFTTSNSYTAFDFTSQNFFVTAGQALAIVLSHDVPGWLLWYTQSNTYGGGAALYSTNSGLTFGPNGTADQRFMTYVDTAVEPVNVPAPGALALLGLGLFGIGAMRRKPQVV